MTEAHLVTYKGMPRYAHTLVECLQAEGVEVSWTPPEEPRGGVAEVIGSVVSAIAVDGLTSRPRVSHPSRFGQDRSRPLTP